MVVHTLKSMDIAHEKVAANDDRSKNTHLSLRDHGQNLQFSQVYAHLTLEGRIKSRDWHAFLIVL
jgi:hypothetical protein